MFKRQKIVAAIAAVLITSGVAWAANTALSGLSAAGALSGRFTAWVFNHNLLFDAFPIIGNTYRDGHAVMTATNGRSMTFVWHEKAGGQRCVLGPVFQGKGKENWSGTCPGWLGSSSALCRRPVQSR